MTIRPRVSDADRGPCLFLVAHGSRPTSPPLRLHLHRHDRIDVGRGESLDVAARRGEPVIESPGSAGARSDAVRRGGSIELALPDPKVSVRHARFERVLGAWCVRDDRSKNGTFVNGERVEQAELRDGDAIDVGDTIFVFRDGIRQDGEIVHRPSARRGLASLLPDVQAELDELARMAASSITILIEGETGTGKEVVARAIHERSGRPGPMVPVNCGGLPGERIEAELFGWRRGAFSGAIADHVGLVRAADRGTLFLDEIGDLPPPDQAALLRVLQEREVIPIGGTRPIAVDLRVVAATHRPLDAMAAGGAFRGDLLARLSGHRLGLWPLRRRREDLGLFLADLLSHRGAEGCRLTIGALRGLLRHDWPTNIRGLEQAITRALVRCRDGVIDAEDLAGTLGRGAAPAAPALAPAAPDPLRERLIALMHEHRGNVTAVAREMGKARMQIQRWIKRYRLAPGEYRG